MNDQYQLRPRRRRTTRASVRLAERVAGTLISVGGIGTVLAVTMILAFLVWVVGPLFLGASVEERRDFGRTEASELVDLGVDDYRAVAWTLDASGRLSVRALADGELILEARLAEESAPTCMRIDPLRRELALGHADGRVTLGHLGQSVRAIPEGELDASLTDLAPGARRVHAGGLVEHTLEGQWRWIGIEHSIHEVLDTGLAESIRALDVIETPRGPMLAVLTASQQLALLAVNERENMLTGEIVRSVELGRVPHVADPVRGAPQWLMLSGGGETLYLAWRDGHLVRFDTRDLSAIRFAEDLDLVPAPAASLTTLTFLLGRTTLIAGDSAGAVAAWFCTKPAAAVTCDGATLARAHVLSSSGAAVASLSASPRTRLLAVGRADGSIELFNVTSAKRLLYVALGTSEPVRAVSIAPKEDALVAAGATSTSLWNLDPRHPEANFAALFRPVWYEGYEAPAHVWQSSSGTDDFEIKLGLWPLVFGTLKATFYSLLFGVPLALLAAIFSSEFLQASVRVPIKSTVEVMAGLPSVVLGFLAAIVIAPFVQNVVPAVLCGLATIPVAFLLCAYGWQFLPQRFTLRLAEGQKFVFVALGLPLGILLAIAAAPLVESLLFGGDLQTWLSGEQGSPVGGWMLLFLPLAAVAVVFGSGRLIGPWLRSASRQWDRARCARFDLLRFCTHAAAVVLLALGASWFVSALGFDPRGSFVDTYVQRNALVVGVVMGFAIIPIIYTIAEDALSSVPGHLRLASLAAGATPWQTAVRVIVPTAGSGLFSACMVGLGRAVGETMIVLMATGNTPVMEWNLFNGFRTLSANIATELPEAVQGSTHYRTLFLAALVLFMMTFVVNTAAEVVRQRFRKRAFQL